MLGVRPRPYVAPFARYENIFLLLPSPAFVLFPFPPVSFVFSFDFPVMHHRLAQEDKIFIRLSRRLLVGFKRVSLCRGEDTRCFSNHVKMLFPGEKNTNQKILVHVGKIMSYEAHLSPCKTYADEQLPIAHAGGKSCVAHVAPIS